MGGRNLGLLMLDYPIYIYWCRDSAYIILLSPFVTSKAMHNQEMEKGARHFKTVLSRHARSVDNQSIMSHVIPLANPFTFCAAMNYQNMPKKNTIFRVLSTLHRLER